MSLKSSDFAEVKKRGVRAGSGPLLVSFVPVAGRHRLGVVITRRVGGAVQRNRIRRVIREYVRTNAGSVPEGDCVVIPRDGAADLTNDKLRQHLERALSRLAARMDTP